VVSCWPLHICAHHLWRNAGYKKELKNRGIFSYFVLVSLLSTTDNRSMHSDRNPLEIFFQKLPMSTALFDKQLIMQRCNPTWINSIEGISQVAVEPGIYFYDLLPGTKTPMQPLIDHALLGTMATADGLRLNSSGNVFYWDAAFVPWIEQDQIAGFLLIASDITERVLSRQILERKVVDRTQKLSALYDVMTVAAEPIELKSKLDESLQRVMDAVHAQAGTIHLLDSDEDGFLLVAQQGSAPLLTKQLTLIPFDDSFQRWVENEQQFFVLEEIVGRQRMMALLHESHLITNASVPMTSRGKILGILSVYRKAKRPFSQEDISLLDSVADQIGTAIENARLRLENEQLLIVEERSRLARELHDAVTQSLYSLTLYAETSLRFMRSDQLAMADEYMEQVAGTAQQALREMRLLLHNLRPAVLEQLGLEKAIRQRVEAVEKRVGIGVDYQVQGKIELPAHVEEALYHIVQESLNNALKHAAADSISLSLCQHENRVKLIVADNGKGFKFLDNGDSGGLGLTSMRERVDSLGGNLKIETEVGGGSSVQVELDVDQVSEISASISLLDSLR